MSKCPKCGSDDIHQDSVDIGVGVQYGPLACNACDYDENDELEELGLLDLEDQFDEVWPQQSQTDSKQNGDADEVKR